MDGEILECFIWLENNKIKEVPNKLRKEYPMEEGKVISTFDPGLLL